MSVIVLGFPVFVHQLLSINLLFPTYLQIITLVVVAVVVAVVVVVVVVVVSTAAIVLVVEVYIVGGCFLFVCYIIIIKIDDCKLIN